LGERLAVSRQAVNAIENGKHDPSLSLAFRIARLFGKSVDSIFDQEEQESSIKTSGVMREPT
jgi:putative transcriptional regulator